MRSKSSSFSGEISAQPHPPPLPSTKLVFVGDPKVGKTEMLRAYMKRGEEAAAPQQDVGPPPPVLEGFTKSVTVKDKEYLCLLWDTIGSTDFDKLRPLSYPKTDCFVICFSVDDRQSLENVRMVWIPEITQHCPDVPYILVCTKADLQGEEPPSKDLISAEEISQFVSSTGALDYVESSARKVETIDSILKAGVGAVLTWEERLKAAAAASGSGSSCRIL